MSTFRTTFGWLLIVPLLSLPFSAHAEISTITATGEYQMGPSDTAVDAKRIASLTARHLALDKAATYLENQPEVKRLLLSREALRAYIIDLLSITEHPSRTAMVGSTSVMEVEVSLGVDPPAVVQQLRVLLGDERVKAQLTQTSDTIDRLRKDLETDTEKLTTMKESAEVGVVVQHRQQILGRIETEEQLAQTWTVLLMTESAVRSKVRARPGEDTRHTEPSPRALTGESGDAEEHRKKGVALNEQGNYEDAIKEFRTALRLLPSLARAHLGLGAALQGKGSLDEAIAEYRTLLRHYPDDADAHNNLGTAFQTKGDLDGAIREYRTGLHLQSENPLIHFNLGTALSATGAVEEAMAEYRAAIRTRPEFAQAYFNLARLLKDKDNVSEAAQALREFLRLAPSTPANQPLIEKAQELLQRPSH